MPPRPATASDTAPLPAAVTVGRERTPWLLLAFLAVLLFLPSVVVFPGPLRSNGSPAVLLSFTMFGLMVLLFLHRPGRGAPLKVNAGFVVLVLYLAANLVTYAAGQHRVLPVDIEASTTRSLLSLLGNVGVALYAAQHVTTSRQRRMVMGLVLAGMAFSAVVAISQAFTGPDLRYLLQPPGFVLNRDRSPGLRDGFVRVIGTADHPIEFAVLASAAVPLALHVARYGASVWARRASGLALLVLLVAIPASVSRSAVIAVAAALLVYACALTGRGIVNAVVALAAALGAYAVISPRLFQAFVDLFANASSDDSITGRTDDYTAVEELFHRYPVFGGGLGTNPTNGGRLLDNQWLSALVEGGVVGVGALALLFVAALAGIVRLRRQARGAGDRSEVFAIGAAFAGIFVCNLTFDLLAYTQATFVLFVLFGMLWGARVEKDSQDPEETRRLT